MGCCTEKVKKIVGFNVGLLFLVLGIVIVTLWGGLYKSLLNSELSLTNTSKSFNMWKETPIPMYLNIYMFNWTNSEQVLKDWTVKPIFEEVGPYVFLEHHSRVNLKWHPNETITYQQKRTWHFQPHLSNGTLKDKITHVNVIAATIGYFVKDWNAIIKGLVNVAINKKEKSLEITRTAGEWLFEGFHDDILSIAKEFKIPGLNFDKFGWFYNRNGSETYDGTFTMYTGESDLELLGIIEEWNGRKRSKFYDGYCSYVNGTSGELWPPVEGVSKVAIFSPDVCSSLNLFLSNQSYTKWGIEGSRFIGTEYIFDNGTKYPEMKCFNGKNKLRSGVRDVSKCKFGAPAFVSYPHFYLADPWYRKKVIGMKPIKDKHEFFISLEPVTGVPLNADAKIQINLLLMKIPGLTMFERIKEETMMPMFWFEQTATLTEDLAGQIKLLLILPSIGTYTGIGLISIGSLVILICVYITLKGAWRDNERDHLLPEKAL